MELATDVRIDKWLWAVRVFKTRSQASAACRAGHVKIAGQLVKPAHGVKPGEIISAVVGPITRTVKVLGHLEHRVAGKVVPQFMEDLTPPEEYQKRHEPAQQPVLLRAKGLGRPTKKDRRQLNPFLSA
jgi:ribosome-associated heat shock protein Hsp15